MSRFLRARYTPPELPNGVRPPPIEYNLLRDEALRAAANWPDEWQILGPGVDHQEERNKRLSEVRLGP